MKRVCFVMAGVMMLGFFASVQAKVFENAAQSYIQQEIRYTEDNLTFSVRRMRLRFTGSLADGKLAYRLEQAFEKDGKVLDVKFAYADIKYMAPYFNFRVGKFCVPSNVEVYWTWPPKQLTVWINPITRKIWEVGDLFDYGVQGSGTFKLGAESKLGYIVSITNGKGSGIAKNPDGEVDICCRANLTPIKGLLIGGWTQLVKAYVPAATDSIDERTLSGVDFWYTGAGLDIRGGYDMGDAGDYGTITNAIDTLTGEKYTGEYTGFHIMGGYTIEKSVEAFDIGTLKIQPVINYSSYAPDIEGIDPATVITVGVNLYLGENLKFMINNRMITDDDGAYFAPEPDDVFEIRTQVLFK